MSVHSIGSSTSLATATYGLGSSSAAGESSPREDVGETGNDGDEGATSGSTAASILASSAGPTSGAASEAKDTPAQKIQDATQEALTGVRDGDETASSTKGTHVNTSA